MDDIESHLHEIKRGDSTILNFVKLITFFHDM